MDFGVVVDAKYSNLIFFEDDTKVLPMECVAISKQWPRGPVAKQVQADLRLSYLRAILKLFIDFRAPPYSYESSYVTLGEFISIYESTRQSVFEVQKSIPDGVFKRLLTLNNEVKKMDELAGQDQKIYREQLIAQAGVVLKLLEYELDHQ